MLSVGLIKEDIDMSQNELEKRLISIRRHLHQYPELSTEEYETTKSIQKWLREAGIQMRKTGLSTGVFAEILDQQ